LDGLSGGAAANILGYGRTDIAGAVADQMSRLHWVSVQEFLTEPAIELANRLYELSSGAMARTYFVSSGSEAVETAVQMVRAYHRQNDNKGKSKILFRKGSFHGSGLIGASAQSRPMFRDWFQPLATDFIEVPTFYRYRCGCGGQCTNCEHAAADAIEESILREGPETVGALLAEPVPSALVLVPGREYLQRVRAICDKYEILWIGDEVFTGMGRTGEYFAFSHFDVTPDIITLSKGLTGGYLPLAAVGASADLVDVLMGTRDGLSQAQINGHTYSAHATCCAAAIAVLNAIASEGILDASSLIFDEARRELNAFATGNDHVGDVRCLGGLFGIELVRDKATKEPFPEAAHVGTHVANFARANGLLVRGNRLQELAHGDVVVLSPPLVTSRDDMRTMVSILTAAIETLSA
jgi:adenosylmethionine-8-amino-7-oxononanoate aminotransferase